MHCALRTESERISPTRAEAGEKGKNRQRIGHSACIDAMGGHALSAIWPRLMPFSHCWSYTRQRSNAPPLAFTSSGALVPAGGAWTRVLGVEGVQYPERQASALGLRSARAVSFSQRSKRQGVIFAFWALTSALF